MVTLTCYIFLGFAFDVKRKAYKASYVEDFWISEQLYVLPVIRDLTDLTFIERIIHKNSTRISWCVFLRVTHSVLNYLIQRAFLPTCAGTILK